MNLTELIKTAVTIKNIMQVVYLQFVLKEGDSGETSVFLGADMLTMATNKCLKVLGNCCSQTRLV